MRLTQTQVWPVFRYFDAIAPSTAASRSASSNTMNGALPPSSSDSFFTVSAHCFIRSLPTSVEPVNDSFLTSGLAVSSLPMSRSEERRVGKECRSRRSAYHEEEKGL